MVTIIILVVAIVCIVAGKLMEKNVLNIIGAIALLIGLISLVAPDEDIDTEYEDWKFEKQIELVSISNGIEEKDKGIIFVRVSSENIYTYRYEIESEFGTDTSTEYKVDMVSGNVDEIEDPKCKKPLLIKYKSKWQLGKWQVVLPGWKTKYVFYVPEGTIQKEIILK